MAKTMNSHNFSDKEDKFFQKSNKNIQNFKGNKKKARFLGGMSLVRLGLGLRCLGPSCTSLEAEPRLRCLNKQVSNLSA